MRDAQELFEDLQLSSSNHKDSVCSATMDCFLQDKLESSSNRRSSEACEERLDEDEEIAKLISLFVNRIPQPATSASVVGQLFINAPVGALPPPVRYSKASRKPVAKQPACADEHAKI